MPGAAFLVGIPEFNQAKSMSYVYPSSDLDRSDFLLSLLGSFWSGTYEGSDLIQSTLRARAKLDQQAHTDLLDLVASISRANVPIFHRENWHFLTFLESQVNNFGPDMPEFLDDNTITYNGEIRYGLPALPIGYAVPVPASLRDCSVVLNRITQPSLTLIKDVDFWLPKPGVLLFRQNPFQSPLVPVQTLFTSGEASDRLAGLWLYHGAFDWQTAYEQFGYALKLKAASSEGYRYLINAILDALTQGTTGVDLNKAWSAITGVPLALGNEVVEAVETDSRSVCVITDQHAYKYPLGSQPVVEAGDKVTPGMPLVDTLEIMEFDGYVPPTLTALALGRGFLANGYYSDLIFENKTVPLVVEQDENGRTRVSFEISGFPGDIEAFWDEVHANGLRKGKTLAQLLDIRPNPIDDPGAGSLPATINPLSFLVSNLLKFNTFVVRVRASLLGKDALGLWTAAYLKKIIPPHTAMIVVVELEYVDEPIKMEGPGDSTQPGYEEEVSFFPCMVASDTIDPDTSVAERVRIFQIKGKCV